MIFLHTFPRNAHILVCLAACRTFNQSPNSISLAKQSGQLADSPYLKTLKDKPRTRPGGNVTIAECTRRFRRVRIVLEPPGASREARARADQTLV